MAPKWNELGLQEQTNLVNDMRQHFISKGRYSPNMDDVVKLCESGYNPSNSDLEMYMNGLVDIQTLVNAKQPKSTELNPSSLEGSLTHLCQKQAEKNQRDEYKRQLAIQDFNNPPVAPETAPNYPNYH
jgi:translation initiation factor RLI1